MNKLMIDVGILSNDDKFGELQRKIPSYATIRLVRNKVYVEIVREPALPLYVWSIAWYLLGLLVLFAWINYREKLFELANDGAVVYEIFKTMVYTIYKTIYSTDN